MGKRLKTFVTLIIAVFVLIISAILLNPFNIFENDARMSPEENLENNLGNVFSEMQTYFNGDLRNPIPDYNGYIIEFETEPVIPKKLNLEKSKATKQEILTETKKYKTNLQAGHELFKEDIYLKFKEKGIATKSNSKSFYDGIFMSEFYTAFNGVVLDISDEEAKAIKEIKSVKRVFPNYEVNTTLMDSVPLIQDGILAGQLDADGNDCLSSGKECLTGKGVTIGIIDTGVDYTHEDLGECTSEEFLARECEKVVRGYDFSDNDDDPMDYMGHGTHVAATVAGNGILKGVAPDAKIYAYKVFPRSYESVIISAIERSLDPNQDGDFSDKLDIISLSLGGPGNPDDPMSIAIDNAVNSGVVAVIAAGNSGPNEQTIGSPGTARKAITVGAIDKNNNLASFSSRGPVFWTDENGNEKVIIKPDVVAPGVNICAAEWDSAWSDKKCLDDKHIAISGTSMATPHVAGAIALIKQAHPDWTPEEIKSSLKNTAEDLGLSQIEQGAGIINLSAFVSLNEPIRYIQEPYFYFRLDMPQNNDYFRLDQNELIDFKGFFEQNYTSLSVQYKKENETIWRTEGINIIGSKGILAQFKISALNNKKGAYIFNISFVFEGATFSRLINLVFLEMMQEPIPISNCTELQNMGLVSDLTYTALSYIITNDIDCSDTINWNSGNGFTPLSQIRGKNVISFFNGNEFEIINLYSSGGAVGSGWVGLFGLLSNEINISNVRLVNVNLSSWYAYIGGITPYLKRGIISNSYVSGSVIGHNFYVGGLVSYLGTNGIIFNSSSEVNVIGTAQNRNSSQSIGGLVGESHGQIIGSYSIGNVINKGKFIVGGLVGGQYGGIIKNSYSSGNVFGSYYVGGLIGDGGSGTEIIESFASGNVSGGGAIGGLVGNGYYLNISNSYSGGNVASSLPSDYPYHSASVGGFAGRLQFQSIFHCYSSGYVSQENVLPGVGGLVGSASRREPSIFFNSFWDINTSNQITSEGGIGKTTEEMKKLNTFLVAGWDFENLWEMDYFLNKGYPFLKIFQPIVSSSNICTCNSCASCTTQLKNLSCEVVKLTNNLNISSGTCISQPLSNKIFDCQNYLISKNIYDGNGYGIYLNKNSNGTQIKNCAISKMGVGVNVDGANQISISSSNFISNKYGIYSSLSKNLTITNITSINNAYYGLYLRSSNFTASNNLNSCKNLRYDIYSSSSLTSFSNTQCTQTKTYGVPAGTCMRSC